VFIFASIDNENMAIAQTVEVGSTVATFLKFVHSSGLYITVITGTSDRTISAVTRVTSCKGKVIPVQARTGP
jgi:hypothetical protein